MCDTGCKSHLHVFRCVLHGLSPSEGDSAEHRLPESNPDVLFARVTVVCTVLKVKLCRVFLDIYKNILKYRNPAYLDTMWQ